MKNLVVAIVAATLAALLVVGGFLASWEVFLRYVEGRTYSGQTGLLLSQLPIIVTRFLLGCVAGAILAILTYRNRPLPWAIAMSVVATLTTLHFSTRTYVVAPGILERIVYNADSYMYIPGAILGALAVSRSLRLTKGSTGRRQSSGPAKPGKLGGGAG
jgi:hypothetical protein